MDWSLSHHQLNQQRNMLTGGTNFLLPFTSPLICIIRREVFPIHATQLQSCSKYTIPVSRYYSRLVWVSYIDGRLVRQWNRNLRFSMPWLYRLLFYGAWRRAVWYKFADISHEHITSIFKAEGKTNTSVRSVNCYQSTRHCIREQMCVCVCVCVCKRQREVSVLFNDAFNC